MNKEYGDNSWGNQVWHSRKYCSVRSNELWWNIFIGPLALSLEENAHHSNLLKIRYLWRVLVYGTHEFDFNKLLFYYFEVYEVIAEGKYKGWRLVAYTTFDN